MFDRWCWSAAVCLGLVGCGSVDNSSKDAKVDSPQMQSDSKMIDSALPANPTAVGVSNVAQFTMAAATFTTVPYGTVDYDDLSEYTASTGTFTAKNAGDYRFCASLYLTANGSQQFEIDMFKNNARDKAIGYGTGIATGCGIIRLAANDTVQIRAYQGSAGNVTVMPQANWQWLTIDRVGTTASVTNTATTPAQAGTFVKIPYAAEDFDDGLQFDASTSKFVSAAGGDFEFCAGFDYGNSAYSGEIDLYKNDVRERALSYDGVASTGCRTVRLVANENIDVRVLHSNTVTVGADPIWGWLRIQAQPATSVGVTGITAFSATASVFTQVKYSAEQFDTHGEFDVGNYTFKAQAAGDYQVCAGLAHFLSGAAELDIYKNGVREKGFTYGGVALVGCRTVRLVTDDQLQIWYNGPTVSFTSDPNWDWFEVTKVH